MAVRTISFASLVVVLSLALAACGGRGGSSSSGTDGGPRDLGGIRTDLGPGVDLGPGHDSGTPPVDMGVSPLDLGHDSGGSGMMCIATCTTSAQCMSSCPGMAGRVACCDTSTHHCYNVTGSVCPAPTTDAGTGTDMSMY